MCIYISFYHCTDESISTQPGPKKLIKIRNFLWADYKETTEKSGTNSIGHSYYFHVGKTIAYNWILLRLPARTRSPVTLHLQQVEGSFVS